ncbi:YceI family protein [Flavobacterium sp. F-65]|jgi:polyisoprenoid-binding protein YceI|uniref:YceI family protein n=1 Tax=Flavobacterium pisciphilum TaxID=2893755 RepID=A0ABS8MTT1_9FLAO|nr:YceI family protein [Flavobacterium sp. F-65]MCC9072196.1 YceI family protein [Flavobacterium sp. F-65]
MKTHWTIDSNQSDVLIKMRHSILAYLGGSINTFNGHVDLQNDEIEDATIEFSLDVNNKEAKLEQINTYLKLNDFFDVNKYPTISFKSTSFQKVNKNINFLKGDLTIKDVTKTVELDVELVETDYYNGNKKVSFELTGDINRKDFGLAYNSFNHSNGLSTGQDIKLVANLEFTI